MSEKTRKLYLSRSVLAGIFVSELQTTVPLRNLILTTIIILWTIPNVLAQQVWPGDINNNGIVNNIDVLYWAVAKDATGEARVSPTTNWEGQDLPVTLWDQNFPEGLNYAYADCDGDGDVDDDDKTVIESNFGEVHGTVVPDEYATGDPGSDPILQLTSGTAVVPPEGTLEVDLSLGIETDSITSFYGIAFTVVYDPEAVGNQGNDFRLDILEDTWLNGNGDDKVIQFIDNDRDNGVAQIAIVRKNQVPVSGFGQIGTFNIVMEDIVLGFSNVTTSDIRMVDLELTNAPIAPSEIEFSIDTTLTPTIERIRLKGIKLYPNPASGPEITVEVKNQEENIRRIQLFDTNGRLLMNRSFSSGGGKQQLPVGEHKNGIYTLKIYTDKHIYVQSFFR